MGQSPDRLAAREAGEDADAAGGPQRGAVVRAAGLALDREALSPGQPAQGIPQARRYFPWWRGGRGSDRKRLPAGLGQIPDVYDVVRLAPAAALLVVPVVMAVPVCGRAAEKISMPLFCCPALKMPT